MKSKNLNMKRFNHEQLRKIVRFMEEHPDMVWPSKNPSNADVNSRRDLWLKLTESLNEITLGPKKTVLQWKKCWADKKVSLRNKTRNNKELSDVEKRLSILMGLKAVKDEVPENEEIQEWNPCPLLITDVSGNCEISPKLNEQIGKCAENTDHSSENIDFTLENPDISSKNGENSFIFADNSSNSCEKKSKSKISVLERIAVAAERQAIAAEKQADAAVKTQAALKVLATESIRKTAILNEILATMKNNVK